MNLKILAVDSSAKSASVAVTDGSFLISESFVNVGLTHSETLMPMIDSVLKNANLKIEDIEGLCATTGPGSFTGIRIGASVIKGLSTGLNIPCAGVSTLDAMAYINTDFSGIICCAMDARCMQVYSALYKCENQHIEKLTDDMAISIRDLTGKLKEYNYRILLVGDGAELCYKNIKDEFDNIYLANGMNVYQRAYGAALYAAENSIEFKSAEYINPVYIRPSQAERELKSKKENKK